jgi:hypothetical protein
MIVQFKNNGFWVPVCYIVSFVLATILSVSTQSFVPTKFQDSWTNILFSILFYFCGLLLKRLDEDYIIDDNGTKHYMEFDNKFMFIPMKIWIYISSIISGIAVIGAIGKGVEALLK